MINQPEFPTLPSKAEIIYQIIQRGYSVKAFNCPPEKYVVVTAIFNNGEQHIIHGVYYIDPEFINLKSYDDQGQIIDFIIHYSACQIKFYLVEKESGKKQEKVEFGFVSPEKQS